MPVGRGSGPSFETDTWFVQLTESYRKFCFISVFFFYTGEQIQRCSNHIPSIPLLT